MKIKAGVACIVKHGAAAAALLFAAAANAQDFSILYHERLGQWRENGPDTTKSSALRSENAADDSLLSFTAFGRPFNVRLERNDVLLRRLPAQVVSSLRGVEVFRGELVDVPGSWARVTRYGAEITGVIFDGAELFAIDSPIQLAPYLRSREPAIPGPDHLSLARHRRCIDRRARHAVRRRDEQHRTRRIGCAQCAGSWPATRSWARGGHGFQHEHARGVERGCEHVEPREHRRRDFHFPARPARQRRGADCS